jgi:hypothetical protein
MTKALIFAAAMAAISVAGPAMADEVAWCGNIDSPKDCRHAEPAPVADNGYKHITIADFLLDDKMMAGGNQKVSLTGTYVHEQKTDWLYPENVRPNNRDESNGVLLIKDNAAREFRLLLMNTWNRPNAEFGAKGFAVLGQVSMCDLTTLVGTEQLPCLIVDDGDNQAGVEAAQKAAAREDEFVRQTAIERQADEDRRAAEWAQTVAHFTELDAKAQRTADAEHAAMLARVQRMKDAHPGK